MVSFLKTIAIRRSPNKLMAAPVSSVCSAHTLATLAGRKSSHCGTSGEPCAALPPQPHIMMCLTSSRWVFPQMADSALPVNGLKT